MNIADGYLCAKDFGASGSEFTTTAEATAGSNVFVLEDVGDFQVGQEVELRGCNPFVASFNLWGPMGYHGHYVDITDEVQVRGWDGSNGTHTVYFIDFDSKNPGVFRWSNDFARTWSEEVPITYGWQKLSAGVEIKLSDLPCWAEGRVITIAFRNTLVGKIEVIDGNRLTLDVPASTSAKCVLRHSDTMALQACIDAAVAEKKNVFIPNGHYRLSKSLCVNNPTSITIQGETATNVLLDIGEGDIGITPGAIATLVSEKQGTGTRAQAGACIVLNGGLEVNIRDMSMRGGMGFDQRDQAGHLITKGASGVWGFYFCKSNALAVWSTQRVRVNNCHARHMSAECFYCCSQSRTADEEPACYTKLLVYENCSVEDCARNGFNNNDYAENTQILSCRVRHVGGDSWEGSSRYVVIKNSYFRDCGAIACGNLRRRDEIMERLGTGQHVIADNVFESSCKYGNFPNTMPMINASACATQVIIRNNTFVNFNSRAIRLKGDTGENDLPAGNIIVTGNSFNMTAIDEPTDYRYAIHVSTPDTTISDNQIYINGDTDTNVTAIQLRDDAIRVNIHDNTIVGCGKGIETIRCPGKVGEVLSDRQFVWRSIPPLPRRRSHLYRGWKMHMQNGDVITLDSVDADTGVFTLAEDYNLVSGEMFDLTPPDPCWRIHDNIIADCEQPLDMESLCGDRAFMRDNAIN